jgi:hypothetical protein
VRILLASFVAVVALAGAAYLHVGARLGATSWRVGERTNDRALLQVSSTVMPGDSCNPHAARWHETYGPACTAVHHRAAWQIPLALLVAVVGVGTAAGIMVERR